MTIKKLLFCIVFLGIALRFYQLGNVPVGFHKDEAFLGYNAYSIAKTGKDMNGTFLPLHLQSFIYSPAGYSYISIPFITLFGLSAFSVRFASAFFGSATIALTFFLVTQLFPKYLHKDSLALLSALSIAISPWHINLSRTATENTIVVFFISLGVLLYHRWLLHAKLRTIIFAFLSFGITLFVYQAARAFLPFFIPLLVFSFWQFLKRKKIMPVAVLFFAFIVLPLLVILLSKDLSLRIKTVSIFAGEGTQLMLLEQIREDGVAQTSNLLTRVFHNKVVAYGQQVFQNYFSHFSYNFLFTENGLPMRYRVPMQGVLYFFELPLLIFGLWFLVREQKRVALFLIGWMLLAPVGAALTFDDVPNLQRTLIVFPALSIVIAFGALTLWRILKKHAIFPVFSSLFLFLALYNIGYYMHQYYIHATRHQTFYRSEGYKDLVANVNTLLPNYKKAVITDRESSPTIFFLFFGQFNSSQFQQDTKNTTMHDFDRIGFANYEFSQEECPLKIKQLESGEKIITGKKGILYVNSGLCSDMEGITTISEIKRPDNSTAFKIVSL